MFRFTRTNRACVFLCNFFFSIFFVVVVVRFIYVHKHGGTSTQRRHSCRTNIVRIFSIKSKNVSEKAKKKRPNDWPMRLCVCVTLAIDGRKVAAIDCDEPLVPVSVLRVCVCVCLMFSFCLAKNSFSL